MAVDLITKLLNKNPKTRLSLSTAMKHAWFKANFDITNRSADGDGATGERQAMFKTRKMVRRGSD